MFTLIAQKELQDKEGCVEALKLLSLQTVNQEQDVIPKCMADTNATLEYLRKIVIIDSVIFQELFEFKNWMGPDKCWQVITYLAKCRLICSHHAR